MTELDDQTGLKSQSFGYLVQLIARRIDLHMKQELAKIDVDLKVFANLMMLYTNDGINQRDLGKRLDYPEYYTSRNVDALVKAGYAERRADPNSRRSFLVFLTDKGREKARQLPPIIRSANAAFLDPLDPDEKTLVMGALNKVLDGFFAHDET